MIQIDHRISPSSGIFPGNLYNTTGDQELMNIADVGTRRYQINVLDDGVKHFFDFFLIWILPERSETVSFETFFLPKLAEHIFY
jgi:hypothetical protein